VTGVETDEYHMQMIALYAELAEVEVVVKVMEGGGNPSRVAAR
jgi:hypothetical protein